jgi:hypothetical protein
MDINSLSQQFTGRKFGELVLNHYKNQDLRRIVEALQGTIEELPESARPSVESWIDEIAPLGTDSSFWRRDCGEVFLEICEQARQKLSIYTVQVNDEQLLNMFNIIVLNFAYGAHKHQGTKSFIQKSIGIGFLRRLF